MKMNDTNNNLNGTVLGNVDSNLNSMPMPNDGIETLDSDISTPNSVGVINQPMDYQTPMPESQNTFFNNPPINDLNNDSMDTNILSQNSNIVNEVPPVVEPTVAYTNPQNINPMPGFEAPGTIGITPPISLEPEKKPKKKSNKILFIIIVLIALAGVGFGTYYVLNYTDLLKEKVEVNVTTKDFQLNVGDTLSTNIGDFADISGTDVRNCSLDTTKVNLSVVGIYEYTVTCGNIHKKGKITVVDNTKLTVDTKTVYKAKGQTVEAKDFVKAVDANLTYEFVEPEVVSNYMNGEIGTYIVKIKVTSNTNKTVEVEANLVIMEHPIKGYITCTSEEEKVEGISAQMTVSEKFAIVNDNNNGYGNVAYEIHTFKFSDETEYTNYLATYKTGNSITINNVTGETEFDDEKLTITITNIKPNDKVLSEYGKENIEKYSTIKSYFTNTKHYSCSYKNVE